MPGDAPDIVCEVGVLEVGDRAVGAIADAVPRRPRECIAIDDHGVIPRGGKLDRAHPRRDFCRGGLRQGIAEDEDIGDYTSITDGRDITVSTVGPDVTGRLYNKSTIYWAVFTIGVSFP